MHTDRGGMPLSGCASPDVRQMSDLELVDALGGMRLPESAVEVQEGKENVGAMPAFASARWKSG